MSIVRGADVPDRLTNRRNPYLSTPFGPKACERKAVAGSGDQLLGTRSNLRRERKIGRAQIGTSGWDVRFRFRMALRAMRAVQQLIRRPAQIRQGGWTGRIEGVGVEQSVRLSRLLSHSYCPFVGSHIPPY